VKVGIVVPYSWSFWGGVVEHAAEQASALEELGIETTLIIGHDPPGRFSRLLHPRLGRDEPLPANAVPVGRSVIAPANSSLANIVLSPSAVLRIRRAFERGRFDLLHVHEPLTPVIGVASLAHARAPVVATFHAAGESRWRSVALPVWGFLLERIDLRIAVSEAAARTAESYSPASYQIVPNGVTLAERPKLCDRRNRVVFVGRHEPRKGLEVLLRAWPGIHAAFGTRLRIVGADPLAVRYLIGRRRLSDEGVDVLGILPGEQLEDELANAKLLVAPSLGGESFGMVLLRAFAAGTPVVASDIDGYRQVVDRDAGLLVDPADPHALAQGISTLLNDEPRRRAFADRARQLAGAYAWPVLARRLEDLYEEVLGAAGARGPRGQVVASHSGRGR